MGRKVLITSLGNLNKLKKDSAGRNTEKEQSYDTVSYRINGSSFESSYIAEAFLGTKEADAVILFGTAGSDWSGLYGYMHMQDGNLLVKQDARFDEDYYDQLVSFSKDGSNDTLPEDIDPKVTSEMLRRLKDSMTDRVLGIVPIRYGRDDNELKQVISSLYDIEALLRDDDELIIDITHGFRSLYLFQILAITYFRSTTSNRKITIRDVTYAMLNREKTIDRVVSLRVAFETMDFIHAAEEFKELGTIYTLPKKAQDGISKEEWKMLRDISRTVSINNISGFMELVEKCRRTPKRPDAERESVGFESRLMTRSIRRDIADYFSDVDTHSEIHMQLRLALWHFSKKQYLSAAVTMEEGLISFAAEVIGITDDSYEMRQKLSYALAKKPPMNVAARDVNGRIVDNAVIRLCENDPFKKMVANDQIAVNDRLGYVFYMLRILRNYLAHAHSKDTAPSEQSIENIVKSLELLLDRIYSIYCGYYLNDQNNRSRLQGKLQDELVKMENR